MYSRVKEIIAASWQGLLDLPNNTRQALLLLLDLILIPTAMYLALVARVGLEVVPPPTLTAMIVVATTTAVTVMTFLSLGLYRAVVRFMGNQAIVAVVKGVTVSAAIFALAAFLTHTWMPRSLPFIYWLIAIALLGGTRLIVRAYYQHNVRQAGHVAIIYGAGAAGRHLMSAIMHGQRYRAALFVDDDPSLLNRSVNGIMVKHPKDLAALVETTGARYVFLAIPSLDRDRRRDIIESMMHLHVHVKTVPAMEDIIDGNASAAQVQEVDLQDLLGREPIPPHPELLRYCVVDRSVMVTGAGGSIGSELCRQIIHSAPKRLILLDQSEYALFEIEQELKRSIELLSLDIELVCLLGSIQDRARLEQIFEVISIDTLYHAAAYKHVPIVEHNILEGLKNNIIGTLNLVQAATKYKVETFTLISTDKAVRPTNLMGASKRFAELILQAYATRDNATRFCMVRFGNVLGSSGSVVPMFRDQIKRGGPVTVTHKDVIRYFMTIPEAAQLVLQASAMGEGGDVFLLDMGEPVPIIELARRMIWLSGREVKDAEHPDGEIEIKVTGLRPGEKLFEELLIGDNPIGTGHEMIMRAQEAAVPFEELARAIEHLVAAFASGACDVAVDVIKATVIEYTPEPELKDIVWSKHRRDALSSPVPVKRDGNILNGAFGDKIDPS